MFQTGERCEVRVGFCQTRRSLAHGRMGTMVGVGGGMGVGQLEDLFPFSTEISNITEYVFVVLFRSFHITYEEFPF